MKITRINFIYFLLFLIGGLSAYYWISPVVQIPGSDFEISFLNRFFRTTYPLFIAPFCIKELIFYAQRRLFILYIFFIIVIPLSILALFNFELAIPFYFPVIVSFISLILFSVIGKLKFYFWFLGASFISFCFFINGFLKFGFEPSTFFGRPRVHFGFIHPVQTASIIFVVIIFLYLVSDNLFSKFKIKFILFFLLYIFGSIFLFLAQSTNIFISFQILCSYHFLLKDKNYRKINLLFLFFLFMLPLVTILISYIPSDTLIIFDDFTSGRIMNYNRLFSENLINEDLFSVLFGPTKYLVSLFSSNEINGFASRDSIFLSFFLVFGLFGLIVLYLFLILLGYNLSKIDGEVFGIYCAIIFFFSADAQGLTPNNLLVFMGLSYSLNVSLKKIDEY